jgi:hypothetical protein
MDIIVKGIKQHDFISGKPKRRFRFIPWQSTNPCREITLGVDPIDCMLGQGLEQGELSVVMAPPSSGRSGFSIERYMRLLQNSNYGNNIINMDYAQLYPEVQRTYEISPQAERLQEMMTQFSEERQRMSEPERMWSKIMLNSY